MIAGALFDNAPILLSFYIDFVFKIYTSYDYCNPIKFRL